MTLALYARRKQWPLTGVTVRLKHSRIHAADCADCETKDGKLDQIETELTLQALDKNFIVAEVPIEYFDRPKGSSSKLNTYLDGILIMQTILSVFKDYKPLACFSYLSAAAFVAAGLFGSIPVYDFVTTGGVSHQATAVLAATTALVAILSMLTGVILDSITRRNREMYQLLVDHVIDNGGEDTAPRVRTQATPRPAVAPAQTAYR